MRQCETLHGRECTHSGEPCFDTEPLPLAKSARFDEIRPSLYFVDVHFNCLVQDPPGACRYVALSYVWGNVTILRAYSCTVDRLRRPGSLWLSRHQLLALVTDAMNLVADMGERYLWVDSLCVLQDGGEAKAATINQMDVIYENALLTIIAAEGNDATAGLPGIGHRPRTRSQRCDVIGPRLRMIVPHSLDAVRHSKWASRAWT